MIIENNKPYPNPAYRNHNGAVIVPDEKSFMVLVILNDISLKEEKLMKRGPMRYGVFVKENIPYLLLDIAEFTLDAPFNIMKLDKKYREPWVADKTSNLIQFVFIEKNNYIVKGQRAIGFETECINLLKTTCGNSLKTEYTADGIDRMINQTYMTTTNEQMIKSSKMYRISGSNF